MSTEPEETLTRRRLLQRGAAGSALLAAGPLLAAAPARAAVARSAAAHAAGAPKKGGTLTFARSVAPTQLDPANSIIAGDVYTLDKIFEPLYVTSPAGQLIPWLADRATRSSADGKTFTFNLRPGVKFSDGTPLTAADVVFSINRARPRTRTARSASSTSRSSRSSRRANKVVVQARRAVGAVPVGHLGVRQRDHAGELRREDREGVLRQADRHRAVRARLGSRPSSNAHAEARTRTTGSRASPTSTRSSSTTSTTTTSGCCSCAGRPGRTSSTRCRRRTSPRSRATSSVTVGLYPAWQVDLLVFNEKLPQFADRHVRRAITYAINRPALVAATSFGTAKPGGLVLPAEPCSTTTATHPCSRTASPRPRRSSRSRSTRMGSRPSC